MVIASARMVLRIVASVARDCGDATLQLDDDDGSNRGNDHQQVKHGAS
jgi:hypothetical protein